MNLQQLRAQLDTLNDWMISAPASTPELVLDVVEIAIHVTAALIDKQTDELAAALERAKTAGAS